MSCLANIEPLTIEAELEKLAEMIYGHHRYQRDYAARNFNATRSDTVNPLTADTAAGGNTYEDRA